ncbi:MAG: hemolysin family protein [Actinomycetota bacterium]
MARPLGGGVVSPVVAIVLAVLAIAASAVLALVETSFTRLGAVGAKTLEETHPDRAEQLIPLLERPNRVLAPTLLLTLACHITAASLLAVVAADEFGPLGVVAAVAIEIVIVFVVAEAMPKTYAFAESLRVAGRLTPLASLLTRLPIVSQVARLLLRVAAGRRGADVTPVVSEDDLLALAEVAAESEAIEAGEHSLIESVISFGDTVARSVMVPRPDMITIEADATIEEALALVVERGYTRFPVIGEIIDDIVGVVLSKDLLRAQLAGNGDGSLVHLLRAPNFVPETKRVAELMPEMQAQKFHLAIVVDEYGGTAGLVTLEDLIEELVGEIVDEFDDEEELVEEVAGGELLISARMSVSEVESLLGIEAPVGDWDTLGGLFYSLLGHVPAGGEEVVLGSHRLRAEVVDGNRIERLRVQQGVEAVEVDEATVDS